MLTLLSLLLLAPGVEAPPTDRRPDVLFILWDDVAERDVDRITTPVFDAVASTGMRFRRAYGSPRCSPARRELMFGYYWTDASGDTCDGWDPRAPDPSETSIADLFKAAGYQTAYFGKWHLGGYEEMLFGAPWQLSAQQHGWDYWRAGIGANVNTPDIPCGRGDYTDWTRVDDGRSKRSSFYQTDAMSNSPIAWYESDRDPEKPWFVFLAFQAPHRPHHNPPGMGFGGSNRSRYRDALEYADAEMGDVLAAFDTSDALVIWTADNGTPEDVTVPSAVSKAKSTTYEDGIRVPMVWSGPGIVPGETQELASFVDVLPTFAALLGATGDLRTDGISLLPLLAGSGRLQPRPYVFSGLLETGDFAVVTRRWKYRELGAVPFLFDLERDPNEEANLAGAPGLFELETTLASWLSRHLPRSR